MNKRKIDIRNKPAFWDLAAQRLALHMPSSQRERTDYARASTWRLRKSCPPLTPGAIADTSRILRISETDLMLCLTGRNSLSLAADAEHRMKHIAKRGDMNLDGTYNRICRWCDRQFTSPYAQGTPTCSDCYDGNQKYRHRAEVESGANRRRMHIYTAGGRAAEAKRNKRAARVAIRALAIIRRQCDRINHDIDREALGLYRRAYRQSIAGLIEKDNWRRKAKRRRAADPCANRGTDRNWWVFDVYKEYGYICAYCGMTREAAKSEGFDFQVDHIVPLGHPCCSTGPSNCAPSCIHCNSSKGNRDLMTWAASKGYTPHPLAVERYKSLMSRVPMKAANG